jgi:putative cardiolipin synthase
LPESDLVKLIEAGSLPFIWAPAEVLFDDPLKAIHPDDSHDSGKMARQLRTFIEEARSEALIISPYFVPRKAGVRWFKKIRDRGVAVKIITNSWASTDVPVAHLGYMRYRRDLLRMGVELYELRPTSARRRGADRRRRGRPHLRLAGSSQGSLHTKILILDRRAVFVGSFNLDPRSASLDTQNGLIIRSPALAQQAAEMFARRSDPTRSYRVALTEDHGLVWISEEDGQEVRYYREPVSGFKRLVLARFLWLFTPESML